MTGFDSKRQAAQAKLDDDDDTQVYADTLLIVYHRGFADGKKAARPEQQAESCVGKDPRCPCQDGDACHYKDCVGTKARPVAQRQWVGLTDEEIDSCWYQSGGVTPGFARTVEAKLKEKNDH